MSRVQNPWAKHRQSFWESKTNQAGLPLWLRITALAYGVHRRNGHAPFKPGDIILATTVCDEDSGAVYAPTSSRISEAIRQAVSAGFLAVESNARCLVVPPWGIEGGVLGSVNEKCAHHRTSGKSGSRAANLPEKAEGDSGKSGSPNPLTSGNVTSLYESSSHLSEPTVTDVRKATA